MKSYLLLLFLFILKGSFAQNLELVWYKGESPFDVLYNGNEDHVKLAAIGQCLKGADTTLNISFAFRAHIANTGTTSVTGVRLRVETYFPGGGLAKVFLSPVIDTLHPGDTTTYAQTLTNTGDAVDYAASIYSVRIEANGQIGPEEFSFNSLYYPPSHLDYQYSTDYGHYGNTYTTDSLGEDGYGFAYLMPIDYYNSLSAALIKLGPATVVGGDISLEVYDPVAFDTLNGTFSGSPLLSDSWSIRPSASSGLQKFNSSWPSTFNLAQGEQKYFWFVLRLYSTQGTRKIELYNDTTVIQPDAACKVFTKHTGQWVPISQGPSWLQNPVFGMELFHSCGVGLPEDKDGGNSIGVYPNPSHGQVFLKGLGNEPVSVRLYDSSGRELMHRQKVTEEEVIPMHQYVPGLYQLQVLRNGKPVHFQRVILQP